MSTIPVWKCLSVEEFINQCNWENKRSPVEVESVIQSREYLINWQSLTTNQFFALSNWSGQALLANDVTLAVPEETAFALTLATNQFWQCFNWSGIKPTIAPQKVEQILKETESAIAEVAEFTLNDLSQLF
ncbi:MAG: hypothetical protein AAF652_18795 [Cyanobacteria bacterium P01_C01_bin.72]